MLPKKGHGISGQGANTSNLIVLVRAHKFRGFNDDEEDEKSELTDFFNFPVGIMAEYKRQVKKQSGGFGRKLV